MENARAVLENVEFCANAYDCATEADAVVIVTEWEQFRALDLKRLANCMARPVIVDLRNVYSPDEVVRHGFFYSGVGRPLSLSY
jgi:UDPglucose 6-dehydrogenase